MARKASQRTSKSKFDKISTPWSESNVVAINQGAKKKSWSVLDIKAIQPLKEPQRAMMESFFMGNHVIADGSAGTGKSYIAMWLALNAVLSKEFNQNKIIIVRSNVSTGQDVGHLPGTLEEKMSVFEAPYKDICQDLLGKASSYDDLKAAGKIEFMPVAFIRGLSWDNAVVIVDEVQNMDFQTLNTVMTRLGKNTKLLVMGDRSQNDLLYEKKTPSGFDSMIKIFKTMNEIDHIVFTKEDIVRSGFVKAWIMAKEDLGL
jgi:phosphate starvation-inducible protein PhoH